jgi:small conductance mechanosensitive channel
MIEITKTLPNAVVRDLRLDEAMFTRLAEDATQLAVNLVIAALILAVTLWAAGWVARLVRGAIGRVHTANPDTTLQSFCASLARYVVIIVGLVAVLQQLGVQATSILALLGAASLAIGLALQGALSNVAAGVMILLFRPYRIGDLIETGGRQGIVKALDLFTTELATPDNIKVVVPNGKVFGDVILNYSHHARRRVDVVFKVPLAADLVAVLQRLRDRVENDPRVRKDPAPLIEVIDLSEAFAQAAVRAWTSRDDFAAVKTDLMLSAHLLAKDPTRELPPPRPSNAKNPSPPMPGDDHHLAGLRALVKRPRRSRKAPAPGPVQE